MQYRTTILENGVRIATREMPEMKSVSVGVWIAVGGRHEPEEHCGISHFLEHLLFKGTAKRSSRDITEEVEGLGGFVNAFTTEDHTSISAKAAPTHLPPWEMCFRKRTSKPFSPSRRLVGKGMSFVKKF